MDNFLVNNKYLDSELRFYLKIDYKESMSKPDEIVYSSKFWTMWIQEIIKHRVEEFDGNYYTSNNGTIVAQYRWSIILNRYKDIYGR